MARSSCDGAMPRPRPPHLQREVTRHGKSVWYARLGKGPRIRIRAAFGTPEFDAEYQAAITGHPRPAKGAPAAGTLAWLIGRYRETTGWTALSAATRRQRENIFEQVVETAGTQPIGRITSATIAAGRERRGTTPNQARHFLDTMRGLFRWAHEAKLVKTDPTAGVRNPPQKKGPGFRMWTEEDMAAYERRWPIGTRQRVWLDVLAYTGLRRGDAVRLGRAHVRDGVATIKTEKSGFSVTVTLPILPALATTLAAGPCGDLAFVTGESGRPLSKESFGNEFRKACRAAGVPGSAHGVRKIAATRAAENGATVAELEAIFGWHGGGMASHYTREADRVRLAKVAMHKLANEKRTSIPAPSHQVRASAPKDQ
jgi:integrase